MVVTSGIAVLRACSWFKFSIEFDPEGNWKCYLPLPKQYDLTTKLGLDMEVVIPKSDLLKPEKLKYRLTLVRLEISET
ncbi:hypothetical protein O181_124492, partial [Austropuccinia psidii MF-1]|nr:hypothetical protein [Austropuccinia psidii MF-1]